jgi:hypothetical protein
MSGPRIYRNASENMLRNKIARGGVSEGVLNEIGERVDDLCRENYAHWISTSEHQVDIRERLWQEAHAWRVIVDSFRQDVADGLLAAKEQDGRGTS